MTIKTVNIIDSIEFMYVLCTSPDYKKKIVEIQNLKGKLTFTRFFSGNGDPPANKLPPRTTVRLLSRSFEMPLYIQRDLSRDHCNEDLDLQQELSCNILEDTLSTTVTTPIPLPLPLQTQTLYINQHDDYTVIYLAVMPPPAYR
jgi:hypothetical protein